MKWCDDGMATRVYRVARAGVDDVYASTKAGEVTTFGIWCMFLILWGRNLHMRTLDNSRTVTVCWILMS